MVDKNTTLDQINKRTEALRKELSKLEVSLSKSKLSSKSMYSPSSPYSPSHLSHSPSRKTVSPSYYNASSSEIPSVAILHPAAYEILKKTSRKSTVAGSVQKTRTSAGKSKAYTVAGSVQKKRTSAGESKAYTVNPSPYTVNPSPYTVNPVGYMSDEDWFGINDTLTIPDENKSISIKPSSSQIQKDVRKISQQIANGENDEALNRLSESSGLNAEKLSKRLSGIASPEDDVAEEDLAKDDEEENPMSPNTLADLMNNIPDVEVLQDVGFKEAEIIDYFTELVLKNLDPVTAVPMDFVNFYESQEVELANQINRMISENPTWNGTTKRRQSMKSGNTAAEMGTMSEAKRTSYGRTPSGSPSMSPSMRESQGKNMIERQGNTVGGMGTMNEARRTSYVRTPIGSPSMRESQGKTVGGMGTMSEVNRVNEGSIDEVMNKYTRSASKIIGVSEAKGMSPGRSPSMSGIKYSNS
jgi:hypothetical protein